VKLSAIGGVILAGDTQRDWGNADYVVALSPLGKTLAHTTVRRQVETALDLGTGSGTQALLLARHAERVTGVDKNRHALSRARLGERLNGVRNVEWIDGETFEPAGAQRFDLVVANPSAISPRTAGVGDDGDIGSAQLSQEVVRQSAELLAEGGFATVVCNWTHANGRWDDAPGEWVRDLGCDALLLNVGTVEPLAYALANTGGPRGADPETVQRSVSYYESRNVERISGGVVVLRRRSAGSNWFRAFEAQGDPSGAGSDQLVRMFAGGDFLASASDQDEASKILTSSWQLADGHLLHQSITPQNGAYPVSQAVLQHQPGINLVARVDGRAVPILAGLDGRRPLATLLEQMPVPEGLDRASFHNLCLETVEDLIARGFLVGS
jgi:SAM-dependent methyltransferase